MRTRLCLSSGRLLANSADSREWSQAFVAQHCNPFNGESSLLILVQLMANILHCRSPLRSTQGPTTWRIHVVHCQIFQDNGWDHFQILTRVLAHHDSPVIWSAEAMSVKPLTSLPVSTMAHADYYKGSKKEFAAA